MQQRKALILTVVVTAILSAIVASILCSRSVTPWRMRPSAESLGYDPNRSRALIVGVRHFEDEVEVRFAVDDAVDLAWTLAFDTRVNLVAPRDIVLALEGEPRKPESKDRLRRLVHDGAVVQPADAESIGTLARQQSDAAGRNGLLIVSFATHGFMHEGLSYLLGSNSSFRDVQTAVATNEIIDIAAQSKARSLILIDACRDFVESSTRGATPSTKSTTAPHKKHARGQVILYAAAWGEEAFDHDGNGIFTKAVLDGLDCKASAPNGFVTARTLHSYVDQRVRGWVKKNRNPSTIGAAVTVEGRADTMRLARCWTPIVKSPGNPIKASSDDATVFVFGKGPARLWHADAGGRVSYANVIDFDTDGMNEVIAGTRDRIVVFDAHGKLLWDVKGEGQTLRMLVANKLQRGKKEGQALAFWSGGGKPPRIELYETGGKVAASYSPPGEWQSVAVDRPTARHEWKIVVAVRDRLLLFDPDNIAAEMQLWSLPIEKSIARMEIVDYDDDATREIQITTANGKKLYYDFKGNAVPQ